MPRSYLNIASDRSTGNVVATVVGNGLAVYNVTSVNDGGHITCPIQLPPDFDPSYGSNLYQTIYNGALNLGAGRVVIFDYTPAWGSPGDAPAGFAIQHIFVAPTPWPATEQARWKLVFNDPVEDEFTFPPGTLSPTDVLGVRVRRLGSNAADTYAGTVNLACGLIFEYQKRCQMPCC